jgi:hypothetical protein
MRTTKNLPVFIIFLVGFLITFITRAYAQCNQDSVRGGVDCAGNATVGGSLFGSGGIVTNVVNTLIYITGIVAVVFIIIGGIRYIVSQGDERSTSVAKNTVLHAVIGLIITILAFAIVNFVLKGLS